MISDIYAYIKVIRFGVFTVTNLGTYLPTVYPAASYV